MANEVILSKFTYLPENRPEYLIVLKKVPDHHAITKDYIENTTRVYGVIVAVYTPTGRMEQISEEGGSRTYFQYEYQGVRIQ